MPRYRFREGIEYAGRLLRVMQRPIENSRESQIALIRLEFEIFTLDTLNKTLKSTGAIACRDIVVGPSVPLTKDSSLIAYANALEIKKPEDSREWLQLQPRSHWLEITFGAVDPIDLRNAFRSLKNFTIQGYFIDEYQYELDRDWVRVAQAARALKISESTVRRRVEELQPEWGAQLVSLTTGKHRRINLPLLRNLWSD
jgi:hypothetical protein